MAVILIQRNFNIMERKDLLPEIPPQLSGKNLAVKYSSPIARAQRAADSGNLLRMIQVSEPLITLDPRVMDVIDGDKWVREAAKIFALPQDTVRSEEQVQEIRAARAEAQQEAIDAAQESQDADNLKKVTPLIQGG